MPTDMEEVLTALLSGFVGGLIPAAVTYLQLRTDRRHHLQERQWDDAQVVAEAEVLLGDIDPIRRTMNLNPTPGAEDQLWADFDRRRDELRGRLKTISAGHRSKQVRNLADTLATEVFNASNSAKWAVFDMLHNKNNPQWMDTARENHSAATATVARLKSAVQAAGSGKKG